MSDLTKAYLGLGANLGDPVQQLVDARSLLSSCAGVDALRCSNFYLSSPVGCADQPDFVNAVVEVTTRLRADELFRHMQRIEQLLGRRRYENTQNAPRLIDIDLLLFANQTINEPDLVVPHPRLLQRLFVLVPLAELIAEHPLLGQLSDAIAADHFSGQRLRSLVL